LTGSPLLLGLIGIAGAVPAILISPLAGVLADRVDQRKVIIRLQAIGAVLSSTVGLMVSGGMVEPWHLYVLVLLSSGIQVFDASIRQALFPRLVPQSQLPPAVTIQLATGRASSLIGPVVAGIAIADWGEAAPFFLNSATYPVLVVTMARIRHFAPIPETSPSTFRRDLLEGIRFVWAMPVLNGLLKLEIVFGLLQVNAVMITVIGREALGVGPEGLGALLAAPAFGALIGIASLLLVGQARRQGRFVVTCQLGYAAGLVALGVSRDYAAALVILAILGLIDSVVTVTRQSVMQMAAPSEMRGRVMGNMGTVVRGTGYISETQSGVLAALFGPSLALVAAGAVLGVTAGLTARRNPALWKVTRDDPRPG
jgi:MFS family permease